MDFSLNWSNLKTICMWFGIIFGALSLALGIAVFVKRREKFRAFLRTWFGFVVVFAVVAGVYALVLTCREMVAEGNFIPQIVYTIAATLLWTIAGLLALLIVWLVKRSAARVVGFVWAAGILAGLVAAIVVLSRYYVEVIDPSGYYANVSTVALAIGAVVLVVALVTFAVFCGRKTDKEEETHSIVFAGVSVALSFALSYVTFFKMPQGGSITLTSILPLLVYSYRFGTRKGIVAGLVYGLLQAVQDPWIIHPAQFLLDYPLAFAMLGLCGWLKDLRNVKVNGFASFLVGGVTCVLLRYVSHVISGIFAFSSYAMEGYGAVAWGFLYNTFCLVDGAIAIAAGALLFANKGVRRLVFEGTPRKVPAPKAEETAAGATAAYVPKEETVAPEEVAQETAKEEESAEKEEGAPIADGE